MNGETGRGRFVHWGTSSDGVPFGRAKRRCLSTCGSFQCSREAGHRGKHSEDQIVWPVDPPLSGRTEQP